MNSSGLLDASLSSYKKFKVRLTHNFTTIPDIIYTFLPQVSITLYIRNYFLTFCKGSNFKFYTSFFLGFFKTAIKSHRIFTVTYFKI